MSEIDAVVRRTAADEAVTAQLLRDKAAELEKAGNYEMASTYHNAAQRADDRAGVWRQLLR